MTAIRQTYIDCDLIGAAIGSTSKIDGVLVRHANVNKWSRYKPVRGTWPQSGNSNYGLDIANNWAYLQPRGDFAVHPDEPFDLGHFRGYEQLVSEATDCMPPVCVKEIDWDTDLYPYTGGTSQVFAKILAYRIAADNAYGILPSLFSSNLDDYYYGVKVSSSSGTWIKTYGYKVSTLTSSESTYKLRFSANLTGSVGNWHYTDLPTNLEAGTITCSFIIASANTISSDWQLLSGYSGTVIQLPSGTFDGITFYSSGTFTLHNWIIPTPETWTWESVDGNIPTKDFLIETNSGLDWKVGTLPSWVTKEVGHWIGTFPSSLEWVSLSPDGSGYYNNDDSSYTYDNDPDSPTYGDIFYNMIVVRLTPTATTSIEITGYMNLQDSTGTLFAVDITQEKNKLNPTVSFEAIGFNATSVTSSVSLGLTTVAFGFTPDTTDSNALFTLWENGSIVGSLSFNDMIEDSTHYSGSFTLPAAADYNDVYIVKVSI